MMNATNTNLRIPLLRPGQILLYDTPTGLRGHVALGDEIRRITLTTMPTRRFTVYEAASTDAGAAITGTIFANEEPGALGKTGNALPDLKCQIIVAGAIDEQGFEFAAWRRTAASGQTYYFGRIKPARDLGANQVERPVIDLTTASSREPVVTLQGRSAP